MPEELVSKIPKTYLRSELYQAEKNVSNTSLKIRMISWYRLRMLNK